MIPSLEVGNAQPIPGKQGRWFARRTCLFPVN